MNLFCHFAFHKTFDEVLDAIDLININSNRFEQFALSNYHNIDIQSLYSIFMCNQFKISKQYKIISIVNNHSRF